MFYRCIRFRVDAELCEHDEKVGPDDLLDPQELNVSSEEDVEYVLRIWKVSPSELVTPREADVPV